MTAPRCPGQDPRYWKPQDVFEVACPACGTAAEFFKDEPFLLCASCGREVRNPRIDLGCAKWCKFAKECLGERAAQVLGELSLRERIVQAARSAFGHDRAAIAAAVARIEAARAAAQPEQVVAIVCMAHAILLDLLGPAAPAPAAGDPSRLRAFLDAIGADAATTARICAGG